MFGNEVQPNMAVFEYRRLVVPFYQGKINKF